MFRGSVVWRGVIYALLMMFGKMITGIWLVRFSLRPLSSFADGLKRPFSRICLFCMPTGTDKKQKEKQQTPVEVPPQSSEERTGVSNNQAITHTKKVKNRESPSSRNPAGQPGSQEEPQAITSSRSSTATFPQKPKSLYPPSILGLAMVARGEVGYLIASLAQSQGMFANGSSGKISDIYLVIIWAISICTLIGPICVGTLVKRVKRLQEMRGNPGSDPLGVWGI